MSKERLEEITKNIKQQAELTDNGLIHQVVLRQEDYIFLYEQAELRQEQVVKNLQALKNIEVIQLSYENLKEENQRYKEVLERIKKSYPVGNDEFVPVEVIYEIQMIIDKALKGESK